MKALIMAAGFGTRLKPLTDSQPKCMVNICGKPILERQLDYLASYGIKDVVINLHYMAPAVYEYFGHKYKDTNIVYLYEKELLGEEGTIRAALPFMGRQFVVMNADTLMDIPVDYLIRASTNSQKTIKSWSVDGDCYSGIQIVFQPYDFNDFYKDICIYWQDIGTPEGLRKARKHYARL